MISEDLLLFIRTGIRTTSVLKTNFVHTSFTMLNLIVSTICMELSKLNMNGIIMLNNFIIFRWPWHTFHWCDTWSWTQYFLLKWQLLFERTTGCVDELFQHWQSWSFLQMDVLQKKTYMWKSFGHLFVKFDNRFNRICGVQRH